MRLWMAVTAAFALYSLSWSTLLGQAPAKPATAGRTEVLVLGVYHMSNPGHDIANMQADDVLSPKRQSEIAEVVEVLRKFHPTKVAVEADFNSEGLARRYGDYLSGKHELSRNETEQLGFRLAKELGHQTIYGVDADGEFPFPRLADYAKAHDLEGEFDAMLAELRERVAATNTYLASHTVLETLLQMNSDERVSEDVGFYYRQAHFGEPWNWAGADLVSDWFRRNMRIYTNIVKLADSPEQRVLVIFGAGHLGWLRLAFDSDPTIRLRKLSEFAQ